MTLPTGGLPLPTKLQPTVLARRWWRYGYEYSARHPADLSFVHVSLSRSSDGMRPLQSFRHSQLPWFWNIDTLGEVATKDLPYLAPAEFIDAMQGFFAPRGAAKRGMYLWLRKALLPAIEEACGDLPLLVPHVMVLHALLPKEVTPPYASV